MTLPTLTKDDIRCHTDPQSFQRGTNYYQRGAILDPVRQGNEMRAECQGSQYQPYRVTVTLGEEGIAAYRCSCPRGGFCKHIVALMLTWVHDPNDFHVIAPIDELLAERSREELVTLIKELIARQPDQVRLLELPLGPGDARPFDPEPFRRQVQYALTRDDAEWTARELERVRETADHYLEAGNPGAAGELYHLILDEVLTRFEDWWLEWDRSGDIGIALQDCAEGLDRCLEAGTAEEETRRRWLETLLEAKLKDIRLGGVDFAYPAGDVVLWRATDEEWTWIEARLRQELQRASEWTRASLVRFMAARREMTGREAEADALILEHGTPRQRAFLLLDRGRVDEAVSIAKEHFTDLPGLVKQFADALVEKGHSEAAVAYMAGQMRHGRYASHYRPWLARHFEEHGDQKAALDLWRSQFEEWPALETYQTLRTLAKELDTWEQLRPRLLASLDPSRHASLLLNIALDEGDVNWALEIANRPDSRIGQEGWERVARAAEADQPRDALQIYQRLAQQRIDARGRGNYQLAARYLLRVRDLYQRLGDAADWETYITHLREEHSNLPALQDELNKAAV